MWTNAKVESFKKFDRLPAFVTKPLSLFKRKILAKVRLGSLELGIETGRYFRPRLEVHQRIRQVCQDVPQEDDQAVRVENEFHFIFTCSHYSNIRRDWLENMVKPDNFYNLSQSDKLFYIYSIYWPLKVAIHVKSYNETTIPFFPSKSHGFLVFLKVKAPNCESWAS